MMDDMADQLRMHERARRDALVGDDMAAFGDLIADDIVHVHTTGIVHDKAKLIDHAGRFLRFLEIERGELSVRPLGPDAAIMTGDMTNVVQRRGVDEEVRVEAFVTQVWVRHGDSWRIASFQATRKAPPPA